MAREEEKMTNFAQDLSPFLEVLEISSSLNQEITTSTTFHSLSELSVKESTFSFVQKMQKNDVTEALPDEDLLEDIEHDHIFLKGKGISPIVPSPVHPVDSSGIKANLANGDSQSKNVNGRNGIGQETFVSDFAAENLQGKAQAAPGNGQETHASTVSEESLQGNVQTAPDLANVEIDHVCQNGQNGNGKMHSIHPWDLPENQKVFVKNGTSHSVDQEILNRNGFGKTESSTVTRDTLQADPQHTIDGATVHPPSGFIGENGKKKEDEGDESGTPTFKYKKRNEKEETGESGTPTSSDENISNHFPGGQGSSEVSHRNGDVDHSDGSIMSRVRIFNALCSKKEEKNTGLTKSIVKIHRKEIKIVKNGEGSGNREGSGDRLDANPISRHRSDVPVAPVPQGFYSLRYFMEHPRRGIAVIINNREFSMSNTPFRKGSDNDSLTLHKTMLKLGFKVEAWTDLTVKSMRDAVDYYATRIDHSDADCFFLAIFSHGEDGIIYGTDGKVNLADLTAPFRGDKSTTLAGKPKIFVVQACRGDQLDSGVDLVEADAGGVYRIPAEADFLYAFSTPTGYFSWRNTELGSWFIQSLCRTLSEHAAHPDMDVLRLLTRVNYEVAMVNESNVPNDSKWHRKKQIPSVVSMLTKDLFFTPKSAHQ